MSNETQITSLLRRGFTLQKIHPHALISEQAELGQDVVVGPFCHIEADVVIGDGCEIGSHTIIKRGTRLGTSNRVGEHVVLGGMPQHVNPPENPGGLHIGQGNTIREFVTVHRSLYDDKATVIGDGNLLMVSVHVAHDCAVGSHAIFTNNVLLAGHVEIHDRAYLSGAVAVHQFGRVGRFAMVGGHARVLKDVPPYVNVDGASGMIVGLNTIGLRRNGFTGEQIKQLKAAYRLIYRRGLNWREIVPTLEAEFPDGPAAEFYRFLSGGTRGFSQERRTPPGATIRLVSEADSEEPSYEKKVG